MCLLWLLYREQLPRLNVCFKRLFQYGLGRGQRLQHGRRSTNPAVSKATIAQFSRQCATPGSPRPATAARGQAPSGKGLALRSAADAEGAPKGQRADSRTHTFFSPSRNVVHSLRVGTDEGQSWCVAGQDSAVGECLVGSICRGGGTTICASTKNLVTRCRARSPGLKRHNILFNSIFWR